MRRHEQFPRRGLSRPDVLFSLTAIIALGVILAAVRPQQDRRALSVRDATQLSQIHKAMVIMARQFNNSLPRPGRVNTLGNEPGIGGEDFSMNHTANVYSCMIAQDYITPAIVVSPVEVNRLVRVKEPYNYDAYNPLNDTYWDHTFAARVDDVVIGSNVSYAHLDLAGRFARTNWTDNPSASVPILSNRGPRDGATEGEEYTRSPTLRFHAPDDAWSGNVVFADNSVKALKSLVVGEGDAKDNLFRFDTDDRLDARMGIFKDTDGETSAAVWDPLTEME